MWRGRESVCICVRWIITSWVEVLLKIYRGYTPYLYCEAPISAEQPTTAKTVESQVDRLSRTPPRRDSLSKTSQNQPETKHEESRPPSAQAGIARKPPPQPADPGKGKNPVPLENFKIPLFFLPFSSSFPPSPSHPTAIPLHLPKCSSSPSVSLFPPLFPCHTNLDRSL